MPALMEAAGESAEQAAGWIIDVGPVVGGVCVGSQDRELLIRLAHYFGSGPPRVAEPGREAALRVSREARPGGGCLYELTGLKRDPRQGTDDFAVLVERLDGAVDEVVAASEERAYLVLHASAVEQPEGRAVLFVGRSMAGKSTTATLFALEGCALFGDECLALELGADEAATARVLRWRRPLSLREDVLEIVGQRASWTDAERDEVLVTRRKRLVPATDVVARGRRVDALPLGHLVWMDPTAERDGSVESGLLFRELIAACHYFQRDGEQLFGSLAALARNHPCSRVRPGPHVVERVRARLAAAP